MARKQNAKVVNPHVEALRPYLEGVAKKLAHDLFGPKGPKWGTTLTELEDIALQTRAILTEKFLSLSLVPPRFRRTRRTRTPQADHAGGRDGLERAARILHPLSAGFFSLRAKVLALIAPTSAPRCKPKSPSPAPKILPTGWPKRICATWPKWT
jgi:hypothetical protein